MTYLLEVDEGAFRASCISGDFRLQESGSLRLSTLLPRVERVKQKMERHALSYFEEDFIWHYEMLSIC